MKWAYLVATFLVITVLGTIFGQSIWQLFRFLYPLLSLTIWIVVLLVILIAFLVYLTTAIRRFHEVAVRRIGFLALVRGQGTQLFSDVSGNTPLRYYDLEGWRGALAKALYEGYGGYKKALPLQEGWPPITLEMDINEQRLWIDDRLRELDDLIARECEASGIKRISL